jgi:hypothetical protein
MAKLYNKANVIYNEQLYNKTLTHNQIYNKMKHTNNLFYIIKKTLFLIYKYVKIE